MYDPMIKNGDVEVLDRGQFTSLMSRVSKETYYDSLNKYTAGLTEVTETVKYSTDWIDADESIDREKIIKDACIILDADRT